MLLHEATFADSDHQQAVAKKHSTVSEAIQIAHEVGATRLLLTHFSQRYHRSTIASSALGGTTATARALPVGLAMDGLCVPLEDESLH